MKRAEDRHLSSSNAPAEDYVRRLELLRLAMDQAAREAGNRHHDFEGLRARLHTGPPDERIEAARALRHYGDIAVEPLCLALQDGNPRVRTAIAESLGELEDPRAIQPLVLTLRSCFAGQSVRWDFWVGVREYLQMLSALALTLVVHAGARGRAINGTVDLIDRFDDGRQQRNDLLQAVTTALGRINDQHPAPELRSILPDLKFVARDVLQQRKSTRLASGQTAARIEAVAMRLRDLPLPTDLRADRPGLPRPAAEVTPEDPRT